MTLDKVMCRGNAPLGPRSFRGVLLHYEMRRRLWECGHAEVVVRVHDELRVAVQARVGISVRSPMCRWMRGRQEGTPWN